MVCSSDLGEHRNTRKKALAYITGGPPVHQTRPLRPIPSAVSVYVLARSLQQPIAVAGLSVSLLLIYSFARCGSQEVEVLTLYKAIVEDGPDLFSLHSPTSDAPFR